MNFAKKCENPFWDRQKFAKEIKNWVIIRTLLKSSLVRTEMVLSFRVSALPFA